MMYYKTLFNVKTIVASISHLIFIKFYIFPNMTLIKFYTFPITKIFCFLSYVNILIISSFSKGNFFIRNVLKDVKKV